MDTVFEYGKRTRAEAIRYFLMAVIKKIAVCMVVAVQIYNMIYLLTAIGLSPGGSNTHLYIKNT